MGADSGDKDIDRGHAIIGAIALVVGVPVFVIGTMIENGWVVLAAALLAAGGANGLRLAGIHRLLRRHT